MKLQNWENLFLFITRESEIAELEALVPDIREKIQDTKDMKQQNLENREEEETTGFPKGGVSLNWLFPIIPIFILGYRQHSGVKLKNYHEGFLTCFRKFFS